MSTRPTSARPSDAHGRDPRRLRDDPGAPDEVRALLEAAGPTPGLPARAARTLEARLDALGPPPPPATGALPWLGAAVVALVGGAVWLATSSAPSGPAPLDPAQSDLAQSDPAQSDPAQSDPAQSDPVSARAASGAAASHTGEGAAVPGAVPTDTGGSDPSGSARPAPRPRPRASAGGPGSRATPSTTDAASAGDRLATEQRLLEQARRHLADDPAAALRATDRHLARFPDGQLAAEREFVAIRALVLLGRGGDADARRARFLARFPDSPYASLLE